MKNPRNIENLLDDDDEECVNKGKKDFYERKLGKRRGLTPFYRISH